MSLIQLGTDYRPRTRRAFKVIEIGADETVQTALQREFKQPVTVMGPRLSQHAQSEEWKFSLIGMALTVGGVAILGLSKVGGLLSVGTGVLMVGYGVKNQLTRDPYKDTRPNPWVTQAAP